MIDYILISNFKYTLEEIFIKDFAKEWSFKYQAIMKIAIALQKSLKIITVNVLQEFILKIILHFNDFQFQSKAWL